MRGATCAIFMMTFTSPADYQRVHRNKVPICSSQIGFIEPLYRRSRRTVTPCEWNMAYWIVGYAMASKNWIFQNDSQHDDWLHCISVD
jgi:hypothetical protein